MKNPPILFVAASLLLTSCNAPAQTDAEMPRPQTDAVATVMPDAVTGEGWGPLKIGMTLAEVTKALGPDAAPDVVGGADPERCDQFRPQRAPDGVLVMMESGHLSRVSLINASVVKDARGLGLGDPAAAVKAAYAASAVASPHKYQPAPAGYVTVWSKGGSSAGYVDNPAARGIVYEINAEGRVGAIHAGGPSIQYVEGCL